MVGLEGIDSRTFTSGWLDIDLDGRAEPYWIAYGTLWYVNEVDGSYSLAKAPMEGFETDSLPAASVTLDVDRNGTRDLMIFSDRVQVFEVTAPGQLALMPIYSPPFPIPQYPSDAASGDFNMDGWPDVIVAIFSHDGQHIYPLGSTDLLLMNRGGHFEVMTLEPARRAMSHGITVVDMNGDRRPDIVESIDYSEVIGPSRILLNITEAGARTPVFVEAEQSYDWISFGMGAAIEDYNQDGILDVYNTSLGRDFLMYGNAEGGFDDRTYELGIVHEWASNVSRVQWSPIGADFNGDGRLDLFIRHGHLAQFDFFDYAATEPQPDLLYIQQDDGTFKRDIVPFDPDAIERGRDAAMGDLDGDGFPDLVTGSSVRDFFLDPAHLPGNGHPVLFHNASTLADGARAISVNLKPTVSADPPAGARLIARCGEEQFTRIVSTGGLTGGTHTSTLFLGWSACDEEAYVTVQWPSGVDTEHVIPKGVTEALLEEIPWFQVESVGDGSVLTLRSDDSGEACFSSDGGEGWTCCSAGSSPCQYDFTAGPVEPWLAKMGEGPACSIPSPYGEYLLYTEPLLPVPGEPFQLYVQQGGAASTYDASIPWLRVGNEMVPWDMVDEAQRLFRVELTMGAGEELKTKLFLDTKTYRTWFIPSGYVVDPRALDYFVFPHQVEYPRDAWWMMFTPRAGKESVSPAGLEFRLGDGTPLSATWTVQQMGRFMGAVDWAQIPAGASLTLFDHGVPVLGPFPTFHSVEGAAAMASADSARGFISRMTLVEDGDVSRLFFTLIDSAGRPIGAHPDWIVVQVDGVVMDGGVDYAYGSAGQVLTDDPGWDMSVLFRAGPGTGSGTLKIKLKDGRLMGTWRVEKRPSLNQPFNSERSSSEVLHDSLPAGVGATSDVNIYPRNDHDELLGMDVKVHVKAPSFLRVSAPKMTESGHFNSTLSADFYGGIAQIEVFINDELLETHTVEIIGPAVPSHWPSVGYPDAASDLEPEAQEAAPPPPTPGCQATEGSRGIPLIWWGLGALMLLITVRRRWLLVVVALLACMNGCGETTVVLGVDAQDVPTADIVTVDMASEDTYEPPPPWSNFEVAPHTCKPPAELPEDNLTVVHSVEVKLNASHLIDIEYDPTNGLVYGSGSPGMTVYDWDEDGQLYHAGVYPEPNWWWPELGKPPMERVGEFDFIEPLGDNIVALTARGIVPPAKWFYDAAVASSGLFFLDVSDSSMLVEIASLDLADLSGLARRDNLLFVLSYNGGIHVVDITDVEQPKHLDFHSILKNPWRLLLVGDYAYVADNQAGLVTLDLSDPFDPQILSQVESAGSLQDIWYEEGYIYAAVGTPGVEVFDLADPTHPVSVGSHFVGPSVSGVSVDNGLLWATNLEATLVFDLKDPAKPSLIATEETIEWTLNVHAHGNRAFVSDWAFVRVMEVYPDLEAPEIDPNPEHIYFIDDTEAFRLVVITNRGNATLELTGLKTLDPAYEVWIEKLSLAPGEETRVYIVLKEGMEAVETTLCIASNDPDESVKELLITRTSPYKLGPQIGEMAPDFVLPELGTGQLHTLSDNIGRPVYLCFFSSW